MDPFTTVILGVPSGVIANLITDALKNRAGSGAPAPHLGSRHRRQLHEPQAASPFSSPLGTFVLAYLTYAFLAFPLFFRAFNAGRPILLSEARGVGAYLPAWDLTSDWFGLGLAVLAVPAFLLVRAVVSGVATFAETCLGLRGHDRVFLEGLTVAGSLAALLALNTHLVTNFPLEHVPTATLGVWALLAYPAVKSRFGIA